MNKIENTMTINIIGKKDNNKVDLKDNYFQFGDLVMKKRKNMSLQLHGIQNIKIYLQFHLVVMISLNKKQVKF